VQDEIDSAEVERRFASALARGEASEVLRLTDTLQQAGRFAETRERLEAAWEALPSEPRIATRLLDLLQRYHNWRRFDAVAVAALDAHPGHGDLHFAVGSGADARGQWQEAWESFGRAAALAPDELEPILRTARAYRLARRVDDAIRVLSRALRRHGDAAPLQAALGYAWIQKERPEKAVDCFKRALERQPDWDPYLNDLAGALMLCERWREAATAAMQSLQQRKRNERAWTVYAIANNQLGDAERAEQGYKNAIRAAQDASRAKGNYGLFLSRRPERLLEAARLLGEAIDEFPKWEEVSDALSNILDVD
jgi:tetratricopeptide (TPR) repeat protein